MASLALGVAGAAVGSMFGPLGASIGWAVGAGIGTALFPGKGQDGPRLTDLKLQGSSYGTPIPIGYGIIRAAGCVIWQTDLVEHKEKHGGKGGPSSTTYSYTASFAVALCEGPIIDVRRIWADGRLIYGEETPDGDLPMTVYLGDEDQLPDPTIEADKGVGNVPGHRGMAYVVFADLDLTPFYNRIPNLEFEIQVHGALDLRFYRDWFVDWDIGESWWNLYAHPQRLAGAVDNPEGTITLHRYRKGNAYSNDFPSLGGSSDDTIVYYDQRTYDRDGNLLDEQTRVVLDFGTLTAPITLWEATNCGIAYVTWQYFDADLLTNVNTFQWLQDGATTYAPPTAAISPIDISGAPVLYRGYLYAERREDSELYLRRWPAPDGGVYTNIPDTTVGFNADAERTGYPGGGAHAASTGNGLTIGDDGNLYWCVDYFGGADGTRLFKLDAELNLLQTWWTDAAEAPTLPVTGYTFTVWHGYLLFYGSGYVAAFPTFQLHRLNADGTTTFIDELIVPTVNGEAVASDVISLGGGYAAWVGGILAIGAGGITLGEIVADVSARMGYDSDEYDVTDLTDIVKGYTLASRMTGRAAIDTLRPIYSFGAVESNQTVKFRKWTGAIDATISTDDLGARPADSDPVDPITWTRVQESELPRQVDLLYLNAGMDYQEGHQIRQREVTSSELDVAISAPVVLTDDEALRAAEIILFNAWMERTKGNFQLPRKYAYLEPTDVVSVDGRSVRITNSDAQGYTHIAFDALATGVNVFVSAPVAVAPIAFVPPRVPVPNVTDLRLLDLPLIHDTDFANGYYAAVAGTASSSWPGATIFKSNDGGVNYASLLSTTVPNSEGRATTALGDFDGGDVFDEMNTVTVELVHGSPDLESSNELGVFNDANIAALGAELIQFKTATLVSAYTYQLSGLLRGRRGTEWATDGHFIGERFVLLPAQNIEGPLAEVNALRMYKAVTTGGLLSGSVATSFINAGAALRPYSPVLLGGGRDGSNNVTLNWVRRTRIGGRWTSSVDVPLSESAETYVVQIWDSTYTLCARIITVTDAQTTSYTSAMQVTDFGANQQNIYFTVGQIGQVGIGIQARGVVAGGGVADVDPLVPITPYANPTVAVIGSNSFQKTMFYEWDWASGTILIDTYSDPQGPIGQDGVVVIAFTTTAPSGGVHASIAGYPGTLTGAIRTTSVSLYPADFSNPWPATNSGYDTGLSFVISPTTLRGAVTLDVGQRYYLNICSRDEYGRPSYAGSALDMRIEVTPP